MRRSGFELLVTAAAIAVMALCSTTAIGAIVVDQTNCTTDADKLTLLTIDEQLIEVFHEIDDNRENWSTWAPYKTWFGPTYKPLVAATFDRIRVASQEKRIVVGCGDTSTIRSVSKDERPPDFTIRLHVSGSDANPTAALELFVIGLAEAFLPNTSVSETELALVQTLVGKAPGEPSQNQPSVYAYFFASTFDWLKHRNEKAALYYAINRRLTRLKSHFAEEGINCPFGARSRPDRSGYSVINFQCSTIRSGHSTTGLHVENRFSADGQHVVMDKNYVQPYTVLNAAGEWSNQTLLSIYASDLFLLQFASVGQDSGISALPISETSLPGTLPRRFTRSNVTNSETRRIITEVSPSIAFGDNARDYYQSDIDADAFQQVLRAPNVRSTKRIVDEFNILKGTQFCIFRVVAIIGAVRQKQLDIEVIVGTLIQDQGGETQGSKCVEQ